ncbi:hypothetical protein AHAS_Ahas19G0082100 [Arachis hypogaea]
MKFLFVAVGSVVSEFVLPLHCLKLCLIIVELLLDFGKIERISAIFLVEPRSNRYYRRCCCLYSAPPPLLLPPPHHTFRFLYIVVLRLCPCELLSLTLSSASPALLSPQSDSVPPHSPLRFEKMKHEAEAEAKVLPLELVEKILLWLPVKSLIRFRLLYLSSEVPEARCVDLEAPIRGDYALQLPRCCRHFSLSILGSSRGFILLRIHVYGAPLLLWNPVTGSYRSVPYPVVDPDASCWTGSDNLWGGLGYDESSDDYLVVVGWGNGHEWRPQWEYFSVRTNSWKKIECGHLPPHLVTIESALFCNGVLYWLAVKDMEVKFVIVAFDLAGKHLSLVSFPTSGGRLLNLFAGCLGLYYLNFTEDHQKFEIWVMKELSWTKLNVVLPYAHGIHPLCLTKGELVGIKNNEVCCHFRTSLAAQGKNKESRALVCMFQQVRASLISFVKQQVRVIRNHAGCASRNKKKRIKIISFTYDLFTLAIPSHNKPSPNSMKLTRENTRKRNREQHVELSEQFSPWIILMEDVIVPIPPNPPKGRCKEKLIFVESKITSLTKIRSSKTSLKPVTSCGNSVVETKSEQTLYLLRYSQAPKPKPIFIIVPAKFLLQ